MPRSPRGERRPFRPPITWQVASRAGAARLAGRPASENACENVCEVACEAAREAACAIARENARAAALRAACASACEISCDIAHEKRAGSHAKTHCDLAARPHARLHAVSRVRSQGGPRGSPCDSLTRCDSVSCHTFLAPRPSVASSGSPEWFVPRPSSFVTALEFRHGPRVSSRFSSFVTGGARRARAAGWHGAGSVPSGSAPRSGSGMPSSWQT